MKEETYNKIIEIGLKCYFKLTKDYPVSNKNGFGFSKRIHKNSNLNSVSAVVEFKGVDSFRYAMFHGLLGSSSFVEIKTNNGYWFPSSDDLLKSLSDTEYLSKENVILDKIIIEEKNSKNNQIKYKTYEKGKRNINWGTSNY